VLEIEVNHLQPTSAPTYVRARTEFDQRYHARSRSQNVRKRARVTWHRTISPDSTSWIFCDTFPAGRVFYDLEAQAETLNGPAEIIPPSQTSKTAEASEAPRAPATAEAACVSRIRVLLEAG